uniref:Uncharacterized protein n=1 Tax=Glossina palpalis gambiensis TaxID=67801 RepID=A0A1B0AWT1_9MUSC
MTSFPSGVVVVNATEIEGKFFQNMCLKKKFSSVISTFATFVEPFFSQMPNLINIPNESILMKLHQSTVYSLLRVSDTVNILPTVAPSSCDPLCFHYLHSILKPTVENKIESTRIDKFAHAILLSDTPVRTYRFHMTGTSKTILVSINFLLFNEPFENEQQIFSDFHMNTHTHTYRHCIALPL